MNSRLTIAAHVLGMIAVIERAQGRVAVQDEGAELLGRHAGPVGETCSVAPVIAGYLEEIYADAEAALLARLEAVSIDAMSREIMEGRGTRGKVVLVTDAARAGASA